MEEKELKENFKKLGNNSAIIIIVIFIVYMMLGLFIQGLHNKLNQIGKVCAEQQK